MKQKVRGTSIDCYYSNIKNKSENKQFRLIIDCLLEKGSATRGEIAHYLKMEKSTVAARVNAMLKYGILQEVGKKKAKKGRRTNKRKLVHQEFGSEIGNIFTEALGEIKIEKEAKRLKTEGIDIDELSCDEFKKKYGKWTKYELECLRAKLKEGKNNG